MPAYLITEHRGRKIKDKAMIQAADQETALRFYATGPFLMPPEARHWRFIDDGLGGGALIDPLDKDHCLRADPRPDAPLEDDNGKAL